MIAELTLAVALRVHWERVEMTAYCPCAICCGVRRERTFSGVNTNAIQYAFAGDRRHFRLGDEVVVPLGLGVLDRARRDDRVFSVDDRGLGLDAESDDERVPRLDLRVKEHWWARQFGRREMTVLVVPR